MSTVKQCSFLTEEFTVCYLFTALTFHPSLSSFQHNSVAAQSKLKLASANTALTSAMHRTFAAVWDCAATNQPHYPLSFTCSLL